MMFKSIHGIAPDYLSDRVIMNVDMYGYDTRSVNNMNVYLPRVNKEPYKNSLMYVGGLLWNDLPTNVKDAPDIDTFKTSYKRHFSSTQPSTNPHLGIN